VHHTNEFVKQYQNVETMRHALGQTHADPAATPMDYHSSVLGERLRMLHAAAKRRDDVFRVLLAGPTTIVQQADTVATYILASGATCVLPMNGGGGEVVKRDVSTSTTTTTVHDAATAGDDDATVLPMNGGGGAVVKRDVSTSTTTTTVHDAATAGDDDATATVPVPYHAELTQALNMGETTYLAVIKLLQLFNQQRVTDKEERTYSAITRLQQSVDEAIRRDKPSPPNNHIRDGSRCQSSVLRVVGCSPCSPWSLTRPGGYRRYTKYWARPNLYMHAKPIKCTTVTRVPPPLLGDDVP
jgi:hypothetical protein